LVDYIDVDIVRAYFLLQPVESVQAVIQVKDRSVCGGDGRIHAGESALSALGRGRETKIWKSLVAGGQTSDSSVDASFARRAACPSSPLIERTVGLEVAGKDGVVVGKSVARVASLANRILIVRARDRREAIFDGRAR